MQFQIDNMACDGCVRSVTSAIRNVDPAADVAANLGTRTVQVQTTAPRAALAAALADIGYTPN